MNRARWALAAVAAIAALAADKSFSQSSGQAAQSLPNPYKLAPNFFKLPADRKPLGIVSGIEIDRDGKSIWVLVRCAGSTCDGSNLDPVLKFDPSGNLVKTWGGGMFVWPHGLYVDADGNIWVTDGQGKNGKGHQVFKFNPDGKVLMTLGRAGVAGDGPDTFNQPSEVLVAPDGNIFVADGHDDGTNARIVKLSKDGRFIKAWGKRGSGPGEFRMPHAIEIDRRGRLLVADRSNNRIEVFDQEGTFLDSWTDFGSPSGLFVDRNDMLYAADMWFEKTRPGGWLIGVRIGSAKDGRLMALIPSGDIMYEEVAVDALGNVYIDREHTPEGPGLEKWVRGQGK